MRITIREGMIFMSYINDFKSWLKYTKKERIDRYILICAKLFPKLTILNEYYEIHLREYIQTGKNKRQVIRELTKKIKILDQVRLNYYELVHDMESIDEILPGGTETDNNFQVLIWFYRRIDDYLRQIIEEAEQQLKDIRKGESLDKILNSVKKEFKTVGKINKKKHIKEFKRAREAFKNDRPKGSIKEALYPVLLDLTNPIIDFFKATLNEENILYREMQKHRLI